MGASHRAPCETVKSGVATRTKETLWCSGDTSQQTTNFLTRRAKVVSRPLTAGAKMAVSFMSRVVAWEVRD